MPPFGTLDENGRDVVDLTGLVPTDGFIVQGHVSSDRAGWSVSHAGDVNGDGIDDLIIGARYADEGGFNSGAAYVVFGTASGFGTNVGGRQVIDLTNLTPAAGFVIQGDSTHDWAGRSVSNAGDVNGDGIDDLIVGADGGDDGGTNAGEAFVLFGTRNGFGTTVDGRQVIDLTSLSSAQGFIIQGDELHDWAGISVSSGGDVNGDGIDDVIIGAAGGQDGGGNAGEAYVVFGTRGGFGAAVGARQVIDLTTLTAAQGFIIQGDSDDDWAGRGVSNAGDLNGDGIDDLVVGAHYGDDGGNNAGEAYVVFGTRGGFGTAVGGRQVIDLSSLTAARGFILQGSADSDMAGSSVSNAGDVNGDGIDDLIVGVPGDDDGGSDAGAAYVIFGTLSGFGAAAGGRQVLSLGSITSAQGFIILGDAPGDSAGFSVANAGDVNGDGIDDLIVGAPDSDGGGIDAGEAYVVFGTANGFGTTVGAQRVLDLTSLTASQGFIVRGDDAGDGASRSIAAAGDLNRDGIDDLVVGAPTGDDGGVDAGEAYVIYGQASVTQARFPLVIDLTTLSAADGFTIQGDAEGDRAGWSVSSAGDVNGDGIDDFIVGARSGDNGGDYASEAYVIFGTRAGFGAGIDLTDLTAAQGFIVQGDMAFDQAGTGVSAAGDVNGDGIDDLIVGAFGGDNGGSYAGEAYVIFGSRAGFGALIDLSTFTAAQGFIIQGDAPGDRVGFSVSNAGDVNGDGIDDLIVGANSGDDGGNYAGEAYVIFGSRAGFGATLDLTNLTAAQGFAVQGDEAFDRAGYSVSAAGDVNGDGIDDLIIGAPRGNNGGTYAGQAYVIFGTRTGFGARIDLTGLTAAQGFTIQGDSANDSAAFSVSNAGDVNGDGIDDLIIGAQYGANGGTNAGEAYVIFGTRAGFGTLVDLTDLTAAQGFIIQGDEGNDRLGISVSNAGDVNGDGIDDLIVGARFGGGDGQFNVGEAYVIFGSRAGFGATLDLTNLTTAQGFIVRGDSAGDQAGWSVSAAGDVDGDGVDDLIVGAPLGDNGGDNAGEAYVIFGRRVLSNSAPAVAENDGLTVAEDAGAAIGADLLDFNDAEQADGAITYTVTSGPANGTLLLNSVALGVGGTFTQADINNNLLSYAHNGGETTSDSFGFSVSDGAGGQVTGQTFSFTISPGNDAPTATNLTQSKSFDEDQGAVALDDIVVTDVDAGDTITATLTLGTAAAGSLSTGTYGSATSAYDAGTGIWTVSGSVANVNAALAAVSFTPTANYNQNLTITTHISDAADTGPLDGTITLTGTAVNDAPTVTMTPPGSIPAGSETQVNTTTANVQMYPFVAALSGGGHVVTWTSSGQDGSNWGIYAQRYDASGAAVGDETLVNTTTNDTQFFPSVVGLSGGGYVVTWMSNNQDGSSWGIYAQRYDAFGVAQGDETLVNTTTADQQSTPSVAALSGGGFVVSWQSIDADNWGIFAQRFDALGIAQGSETLVNTTTASSQDYTSVAGLSGGGYVVTWTSNNQDGSGTGIYAQRYDALGVAQGGETLVNTTTADYQIFPSVAGLSGGGYVITWLYSTADGTGTGIHAQRYDALGVAQGSETQVNAATIAAQAYPSVAALSEGGYVITWTSQNQNGTTNAIHSQRYDASGVAQGGETRVNTAVVDVQYQPRISAAGLSGGGHVVTWQSPDGSGGGIHTQRYESAYGAIEQNALDLKASISIADVDAGAAVVTATLSVGYGVLHIDAGTSGASVVSGNDTGSVVLSGTIAQIDALLNTNGTSIVTFTANTDAPPATTTLTVSVADGGASGTGGSQTGSASATIQITAVNDPVTLTTADDAVEGFEDQNITFNIANGNQITISEPDGGYIELVLTVASGTVTLSQLTNLLVTSGENGTATVGVIGLASDINAALDGLVYRGNLNYQGPDELAINFGAGSDTDVKRIAIQLSDDGKTDGTAAGETIAGSSGSDYILGYGGNDDIDGGGANDIIDGGAGADDMSGGLGNDTYYVDDAGDLTNENPGEGNDAVSSTIDWTLQANTENLLLLGTGDIDGTGNSLANVIIGNSGVNTLDGGEGADTLNGMGGDDVMIGGIGNDTFFVDSAGDQTIENANEGIDTVRSTIAWTLAADVENLMLIGNAAVNGLGNGLSNTMSGNSAFNILSGAGGNDTLSGGAGPDQLIGGLGDDVYVVDDAGDDVVENLNQGNDHVLAAISYTLAANVEKVTLTGSGDIDAMGNGLDNVMIGNSGINSLTGGGGHDSLNGMAGADTMTGGTGNDLYIVDNVNDDVVENLNEGTDSVQSSVTYAIGDNIEFLFLSGAGNIDGTGNGLDNSIEGNGGNNVIDGGTGADFMRGHGGNDTYVVDSTGDRAVELSASGGTDTVLSTVNFTLGQYVENLTLTGTDNIRGNGNELGNVLTGNSGNNSLNGLGGADTMIGGTGNDIYFVDDAGDDVVENGGEGIDTVHTEISYTLADHVDYLYLSGTGNIDGTGNGLDNTMEGNAGNNVLDGGAGADFMRGGAGNDTYVVDNALDKAVELNAAGGTDTVQSSVSFILAGHLENLTLTGAGNINGTGNTLANTITGNGGNNVLRGNVGADALTGGAGTDTFIYGLVADSDAANGIDTILDFFSGDKIDLSAIDANGAGAGNGTFSFTAGAFTNVAGQLRVQDMGGYWEIQGDTDGDGDADLVINLVLADADPITSSDFIL